MTIKRFFNGMELAFYRCFSCGKYFWIGTDEKPKCRNFPCESTLLCSTDESEVNWFEYLNSLTPEERRNEKPSVKEK